MGILEDKFHIGKKLIIYHTFAFIFVKSASITSRGTEFFLSFPRHSSLTGVTVTQQLVISNPTNVSVTARVWCPLLSGAGTTQNSTVPAGGMWSSSWGTSLLHLGSAARENKGVFVTATGPVEVQVLSTSAGGMLYSRGSYSALPREALSRKYVIATHCELNDCFCQIVVTENNTNVCIRLHLPSGGPVNFNGSTYAHNDVISTSGDAGHVIQITCTQCDFSGSLVQASRAVAVIAGGQFTGIGKVTPKDLVVEQFLPTETFGTSYVLHGDAVLGTPTEIVKVITGDVATNFTYNGATYTSSARKVFSFIRTSITTVEIVSTRPVLVAQFVKPDAINADPVMVVPLPVSAWQSCYEVFIFFENSTERDLVFVTEKNSATYLSASGSQFPSPSSTTGTSSTSYTSKTIRLNQGANGYIRLQGNADCSSTPLACRPFSGYIYGGTTAQHYAWSAPVISPCWPSTPFTQWAEESFSDIPIAQCPAMTDSTTVTEGTTTDAVQTSENSSPWYHTTDPPLLSSSDGGMTQQTAPTVNESADTTIPSSTPEVSESTAASRRVDLSTDDTLSTLDVQETTYVTSPYVSPSTEVTQSTVPTTQDSRKLSSTLTSVPTAMSPEVSESTAASRDADLSTDDTLPTPGTKETTYTTSQYVSPSTDVPQSTVPTTQDSRTLPSTLTSMSTATSTVTSRSSKLCQCKCSPINTTTEALAVLVLAIQQDLTLQRRNLAQFRSQFSSAWDPRVSAISIGVTGVTVLVSVAVLLLCCDLFHPRRKVKKSDRSRVQTPEVG